MKTVNRLWVALGLGYIVLHSLSTEDFNQFEKIILTKIYQLSPNLFNVLDRVNELLNADFNDSQKNKNELIQNKIDKVQEEINNFKTNELAEIFLEELKKGEKHG
ncbi:hypothetical protein [Ureaplasma ceti]|uniref:Uncharacterized protein n=1 Tax=Ureaplasma ceti TaxID=3119530 RepID=A0ABP9U9U6_9BACT